MGDWDRVVQAFNDAMETLDDETERWLVGEDVFSDHERLRQEDATDRARGER